MRKSCAIIAARALALFTGYGRMPTSLMLIFVSAANAAEWYRDTFHPLFRQTRGDPLQGALAVTVAAAAFLLFKSEPTSLVNVEIPIKIIMAAGVIKSAEKPKRPKHIVVIVEEAYFGRTLVKKY